MKDKKDDHWFLVYGQPGAKFMKDGKYYDNKKRPVEIDADGNVTPFIEKKKPKKMKIDTDGNVAPRKPPVEEPKAEVPEESKEEPTVTTIGVAETEPLPESLELIDRIKITSPSDPNFLKKASITKELNKRHVNFSFYLGRKDLLEKLKAAMGLVEDV